MASVGYSHVWRCRSPRPWVAAGVLVLLLSGHDGRAQARSEPAQPRRATETPPPLSPQKMEEALRMLLRADSIQSRRQRAQLGPESSGLVVDQTITKIGHDFYDQFYSHWEAPAESDDFTIVISEKPSRVNSAIVTVTVNDEELLELPLQSKADLIEDTAQQAVGMAAGFLRQARSLTQQLERGNRQALETY